MAGAASTVALQHGNRLVREMLAGYLLREPGINVVGTAPSGPELIQLCKLRRPDTVVFEVDVPRWSNERLVTLLQQTGRQMRMVGVHEALPAPSVIRAYEAGVSAVVSYASGLDALLEAVKTSSLPVDLARETGADRQALTEQELRVLYLISAGLPPHEIATELDISLNTVRNHKKRIFSKLNVHNQAHAAASAVRLGLHASGVPSHPPNPRKSPRRQGIRVVLTASAGRLAEGLREILGQHGIPVLDGGANGQPASGSGNEALITVLVNPRQSEWRSLDGRVVIVDGREIKRSQVITAFTSGVTIVPASRIGDLLIPAVQAAGQDYVLANSTYVQALFGPPNSDFAEGWRRWELTLTPREKEILTSISHGHVTKQTARLLGISTRTVENLQSNLFKKLRVHSRAAALAVAHDLGLLDE